MLFILVVLAVVVSLASGLSAVYVLLSSESPHRPFAGWAIAARVIVMVISFSTALVAAAIYRF